MLGAESAILRVVDHGSNDIRGQHVGRELQAFELHIHAARQCFQGQRLSEARHSLQQHMAIGEQSDQQPVDQVLLTHDDPADFLLQRPDPGGIHRHPFACRASLRVSLDRRGR